jgi:hypothetical protein
MRAAVARQTVKPKIEAVTKIQADMALLRFKGVKAIASNLTVEQKTQLKNAPNGGYPALFGMMGGGQGRHGGGGGGNN